MTSGLYVDSLLVATKEVKAPYCSLMVSFKKKKRKVERETEHFRGLLGCGELQELSWELYEARFQVL
jgi:hypothetical protein